MMDKGFINLVMIILGGALYTLLEYWVHRGMHRWGVRGHKRHHTVINEEPKLPFLIIAIGLYLFLCGAGYQLEIPYSWEVLTGTLIGYGWYIFLHNALHSKPMEMMEKWPILYYHHMAHHRKSPFSNFGVVTTFWDMVFRTRAVGVG